MGMKVIIMDDLDYLRKQIDEIDDSLVESFLKRMEIVKKVADYKKKNGMNVLVKERENQVIEKHTKNIKDETERDEIKGFLENIMYLSRQNQEKTIKNDLKISEKVDKTECDKLSCNVGYQGIKGSFSYQALLDYFGEKALSSSFLSFKNVFEALDNNEIQYGVLPIENSFTGSITEVYDLLGKYNFYIVGEKCIYVEHNLLGVKGTKLSDIKEVYSHEQAFLQCSGFLENYPKWRCIPYMNTAKSAEYVSMENLKSKACIAAKQAAEIYGLSIIKQNINNVKNNYTRFIIIGKKTETQKGCNKVSIVIALPHKAGSLCSVLMHFKENNLNMVKIESRPIKGKSWQYFFYIDFIGNLLYENTKNALKSIEKESLYFRFLGNYATYI